MMVEMKKSYYITEMEFAVLLTAIGQKQLYGYSLQTIQDAKRDKVIRALFSLTKKGIVCPEENGLRIKGEYKSLLEGIAKATRLYVTADRDQNFPQLYVYEGDRLTILQSSGQTGIMIKIEVIEKIEFADRLLENGFLHESSLQESTLYKKEHIAKIQGRAEEFSMNIAELSKLPQVRNILLVFDIAKKEKVQQFLIIDKNLNEEIVVEDGKEIARYFYSPKKMIEIFEECVGGLK
jgi:hypothetical protein